MRVLMFGWEFPPYISGGLGTACYGMTQALARCGVDILFLLPHINKKKGAGDGHITLCSASGITARPGMMRTVGKIQRNIWENQIHIHMVDSPLFAYATPHSYRQYLQSLSESAVEKWRKLHSSSFRLCGEYGSNLMQEVHEYGKAAALLALETSREQGFDIIHAHDWMTYPAGILVKKITGKPLVVHVHATEYDRCGENINPEIVAIEREGMNAADIVMAVSHRTRDMIIERYGIPGEKVMVVYNAVSPERLLKGYSVPALCRREKRVLFMGRVTFQKGPEYFLEAAAMVLRYMPDVRFIMAGSGDMLSRMIRRAGELRIGSRVHFPGFMRGGDVDRMYSISDLYVMPSVSEPFGIAPLEAVAHDVPVLLSRQSGVVEILRNALTTDFWDVREMADKICAVLSLPRLASSVVSNCQDELRSISWDNSATHILEAYNSLM